MIRWRSRRLLAALVAVGAVVALWLLCGGPTFGLGAGDDEVAWEVRRGDLPITVEVTGTLRSTDSQFVGPPQIPGMWNYKISWMAPEGSEARAGSPVLRFDTTELQRELLEKTAERDSAETELEKKRVDLARALQEIDLQLAEAEAKLRRARLETEVPSELTAAKELAEAKIDRRVAEIEVESLTSRRQLKASAGRAEVAALEEKRDRAASRVAEIESQIGKMTVPAARGGTVIYVTQGNGEKTKVGDTVWQMRQVIEIPDLSHMEGDGVVGEADSGRLALGQAVTLRLDAHPDHEYHGTVGDIDKAVQRRRRGNPIKEVGLVVALVETDTERMRPGMRFQGTVEVERAEDVLLAPVEAVTATPAGPVVRRRTLLGAEPVAVELGRTDGEQVEVLSGLAAGERLLPPDRGTERTGRAGQGPAGGAAEGAP